MRSVRPAVFLHIGSMKSGTTFLQSLLQSNRENLWGAGVQFPGGRLEQALATSDVLHRYPKHVAPPPDQQGAWDRLVHQIMDHRGTSVVSREFLSFADADGAERIVRSLHGADVHVVLTVRDAGKVLPSYWQTHIRNGGNIPWPKFLRAVRRGARDGATPRGLGPRTFLAGQDVPTILGTWTAVVPPKRVHVLTVPPSGKDPSVLRDRFARVLGVSPGALAAPPTWNNPSIGHPSTELVRLINLRTGRSSHDPLRSTIRHELVNRILSARSAQEPGAELDLPAGRFAVRWNRRSVRGIRESGVAVVGSVDELSTQLPDDAAERLAPSVDHPRPEAVLEAARTARDGLMETVTARCDRLRSAGHPVDPPLPALDHPTPSSRWPATGEGLETAVDELTQLLRLVTDLQHQVSAPGPASQRGEGSPAPTS
jgi:hypothetical protein